MMLPSFRIQGFRAFKHLEIPSLGQINLIVGKNNTGKTMLLEALRLYRAQGNANVIRDLLMSRDEFGRSTLSTRQLQRLVRLESLFFGRQPKPGSTIQLGPLHEGKPKLELTAVKLRRPHSDEGSQSRDWEEVPLELLESDLNGSEHETGIRASFGHNPPRILGPEPLSSFPFGPGFFLNYPNELPRDHAAFVSAVGLSPAIAATWWDTVSLTDAEERITECLGLLAPIQRITFVETPVAEGRVAMIRLKGEPEPVPLRSLGDGMRKMFHFALALEAARQHALLLIDELENGIHYEVHPQLWEFLLKSAQVSGVQIFATTHSWDCIAGLQQALQAHPLVDVRLLKLYRQQDQLKVSVLDREDLTVLTRDRIEVR